MDTRSGRVQSFWQGHRVTLRIAGLLLAVAVFAVLGYAGLRPAQAQEPTPDPDDVPTTDISRTLSASGAGTVDVMPDRAMVVLGVVSQAEMATEAMSQTNETMQDVVDALTEAGVAVANIQTQVIQLEPVYEQPQEAPGQQTGAPELVGFRASNIVELTLTSLENVGDVLDAAVTAGANQIQSIRFIVNNPNAALRQARQAAWDDAEAKAEQLADLAGAELGPVVTINDATQGPIPFASDMAFEQALGGGTPVQPGQQSVRVDLYVTWSLE